MAEYPLTQSERLTRRHVRVKCVLSQGGVTRVGSSTNVSATGLHVRVPKTAQSAGTIEVGSLVDVTCFLFDRAEPLRVSAHVVWIDPRYFDVGGQASVGYGLRLFNPAASVVTRLTQFVENFRYTVMAVDDEPDNLRLMERMLRSEYRFVGCTSGRRAIDLLETEDVAVLITDERMPDISGLAFLRQVSERMPHSHLIRILVSAYPAAEPVLEFVNVGKIFHFIPKPVTDETLLPVVRRAIDAYALGMENERLNSELERANRRLENENAYLRRRVEQLHGFEGIIGRSPKLRAVLLDLERIRDSEATVHIHGETGTGKELVARALHFGGHRKSEAFVALNCAGMTESLQHSTLFGHRKGAFTGADRDHPGVFLQAHKGTLFMDEVADLAPSTQGSLLRAIQEREIVPLGARDPVSVDVRLISATHKDLRREVSEGRFREDLYFRLAVITAGLPPLRERPGDITLLVQHFLDLLCERYGKNITGMSPELVRALEAYRWPGNVRELENEIERVVVLGENGARAGVELLSEHVRAATGHAPASTASGPVMAFSPEQPFDLAVENFERGMIEHALAQNDWVYSRAARTLGLERSRFGKMCKRLGIVEKP